MTKKMLAGLVCGMAMLLSAGAALGQAVPIAHYTLDQTAADLTGNYGDAGLYNAPYEDGGVYINGLYLGTNPEGSLVETAFLTGLDFNSFTVSVEFKIAEIPAEWHSILFGGPSWRWIGASISSSGRLWMSYNGTDRPQTDTVVTPGEWHTLALSYDGVTGVMVLDGVELDRHDFVMVHQNDRYFTSDHPGRGVAFLGHLRNLIVYDRANESVPSTQTTFGSVKALFR